MSAIRAKFGKIRRVSAVATLAVATAAVGLAAAPSAQASGANWLAHSGGCTGWTIWSANTVTGWVNSGNGDVCEVVITQNGASPNANTTTGANVSTKTYWHGYGSNGTLLTDVVGIRDLTKDTGFVFSPAYS
jgi:hypothetical protein